MNTQATRRDAVRLAYSAIAEHPATEAPFPTGRALAEELGYPAELLATLPASAVEAFCGISNVSLFAEIPTGATVLDLGAGAGLDTLIAARRTGEQGKVVAIDFSPAMLARACRAIAEAGATHVETHLADAEHLPLEDESMDIVLVNGIFNLNPYRERLFREVSRVLLPGGAVYASELVLSAPLSESERGDASHWFS